MIFSESPNLEAKDIILDGLRVLVAEDNELNREIISQLLSLCNISFESVVDGRACVNRLEAAKENTFDAVLMDMQMPNMNGKAATMQLRKSSREDIRNIPVIAISADAFDEKFDYKEIGINGYITKPVDVGKLKAELKRVLAEQNGYIKENEACDTQRPSANQGDNALDACEIFSYEKLYEIFASDETILNILQTFLSTHKEDYDKLKKCLDADDYQSARPIIHSLIGVSGNFCLNRLFNISKKLQAELHSGKIECFNQFAQVWEQTIQSLDDICKALSSENTSGYGDKKQV